MDVLAVVVTSVLFFIIFLMAFFFYPMDNIDNSDNSNGFWHKYKSLFIIAGVISLLLGVLLNSCDPYAQVDSGFNEWTGEPKNKDPFNYYNRH